MIFHKQAFYCIKNNKKYTRKHIFTIIKWNIFVLTMIYVKQKTKNVHFTHLENISFRRSEKNWCQKYQHEWFNKNCVNVVSFKIIMRISSKIINDTVTTKKKKQYLCIQRTNINIYKYVIIHKNIIFNKCLLLLDYRSIEKKKNVKKFLRLVAIADTFNRQPKY